MPVYRFGEFVLDTRSGELGRDAHRVRLRPQPAAVLEHLLQRPGQVVTRADLRQVLWPEGTYVAFDHGLNSCIKQLRAALLDDRAAPRYLETLPRRGYRFVGHVLIDQSAPASPSPAEAELSDDFVVSGSATVTAGRMRVRLQLIDRRTNSTAWSTEFEVDAGDMRGAQTRMSAGVAEGLAATLPRQSSRTIERRGHARAAMM